MPRAQRLLLVYNADWNLLGGIRYAAHLLKTGEDPCSLCEITYDGLGENDRWKQCRLSFDVPVDGVYRNQLDAEQQKAAQREFPCVLADTDEGYVRLLGPADLDGCRGEEDSVACLWTALQAAIERENVRWAVDDE